ncbi:CDC42 binding protein kinase [Cichlidogyrus casuarinus]|uniref:CDC42 binding protein kinase n=1 Tax=Cichlidogyrus casuarinus TaxID=1844966 RepID=A0ABD2PTC1_9PLAT
MIVRELCSGGVDASPKGEVDSNVLLPFADEVQLTTASPLPPQVSKTGVLLELPLVAIVHVRNVTACDVLHASEQDLPRIFQVIYDQTLMQQHCTVTSLSTSSSSSSSELPLAAQQLLAHQGPRNVRTLPRKLSFSSTKSVGQLTTLDAPPQHAKSASINSTDSSMSAPQVDSTTDAEQGLPAGAKYVPSAGGGPPLLMYHGHMLQRIQFRSPAVCELCHKSCWSVLSPTMCLQCQNCQLKLHASHVERREESLHLPPCAKATVIRLFRTKNETEKMRWFNFLTSTLQNMRSSNNQGSLPFVSPAGGTSRQTSRELTRSMSVVYRQNAPGREMDQSPVRIINSQESSLVEAGMKLRQEKTP